MNLYLKSRMVLSTIMRFFLFLLIKKIKISMYKKIKLRTILNHSQLIKLDSICSSF